jgi:two-component system, OmpR family, sensor kinase
VSRRRLVLVLAAALALFVALHFLVWGLYRSASGTIDRALADRLEALGRVTARALSFVDPQETAVFLRTLVDENRLEDGYLLSGSLRTVARARGEPGDPVNLMRIDPERLQAALAGRSSVDAGYAVAGVTIESGIFSVPGRDRPYALVLEAGTEFLMPARRLRLTYAIAEGVLLLLAALVLAALLWTARALERHRLAYGRAERLAATGQMAAMVAHEVRNPLGILRGHVELLRERHGAALELRGRERLEDMLEEVDRIRQLTDDFLSLARESPLDLRPCPLAALVDEVLDALRVAPTGERASFEADVPASLVVHADHEKLRRLLLNIVLNAAQVVGDGVRIRVEGRTDRTDVVLRIIDDGPGVPDELRERIFEPFVTGRRGGSGLGLAIARRIAELHGGSLEHEAPPGGGAVFVLRLPSYGK